MIDKIDYHAREQTLKNRDSDRFWNVFKMSLEESILDKQNEVNDLATQGEALLKCRIELKFLQSLVSGDMIDGFVTNLETQKIDQEEEIQSNIKKSKEKQVANV